MSDFAKLFSELFVLVKQMRIEQDKFFRMKGQERSNHQRAAMDLERQVDRFICEFEGGQQRLFRSDGSDGAA